MSYQNKIKRLNENSVPFFYVKKEQFRLPSDDEFNKHLIDNALKPSNKF